MEGSNDSRNFAKSYVNGSLVLKSLKQRKLVKEVKCVNSTRKIVYMLSNLEPDRSVTGGAWYSDQGRGGSYSLSWGLLRV